MCLFRKKHKKKKAKSKVKKNDLRFNYSHRHIAHIKKVSGKKDNRKATSVFLSTKDFDDGIPNVPMNKPIQFGKSKSKSFIKRVRTYNVNSYSEKLPGVKLSRKDKKISNELYKTHLKNKR